MKPKPYSRSKRYFFELTRSQLFFSIAGFLFILCWVFILGVFFGRGYVSETIARTFKEQIQKLQEEKKELLEKYGERGTPKEEVVEPPLGFYKDLHRSEAPPGLEVQPKPTPPPVQGPSSDRPPSSDLPESKTVEKVPGKASEGMGATVTPESRKPSKESALERKVPKPAAPATGASEAAALLVQVGSYREEATAQTVARRLTAKGYPARVQGKDLPQKGGKWYRVQIGPFPTRFEAEKIVIRLEHDGFQGVVVGNH